MVTFFFFCPKCGTQAQEADSLGLNPSPVSCRCVAMLLNLTGPRLLICELDNCACFRVAVKIKTFGTVLGICKCELQREPFTFENLNFGRQATVGCCSLLPLIQPYRCRFWDSILKSQKSVFLLVFFLSY